MSAVKVEKYSCLPQLVVFSEDLLNRKKDLFKFSPVKGKLICSWNWFFTWDWMVVSCVLGKTQGY